ncbi:hypothetical protein [Frondihabitans sp. 762G35]|nr:hypothetical protein [Frondihabitans sp. 762G35]
MIIALMSFTTTSVCERVVPDSEGASAAAGAGGTAAASSSRRS